MMYGLVDILPFKISVQLGTPDHSSLPGDM